LLINEVEQSGSELQRVRHFMTILRQMSASKDFAEIRSANNFPSSAGIASSASAFAALALAGVHAYGLDLSQQELSRLARRGSGSACRSIPAGFVEWLPGRTDLDSYAVPIAQPQHWDLWDCIAVVQSAPKLTGSSEGHALAATSPLQSARVLDAPRRLSICREAIQKKDFAMLAEILEQDSNLMHAVMLTSQPPLMYWEPSSILLMKEIVRLRQSGIAVAYTLDAGPNVHAICTAECIESVQKFLSNFSAVQQLLISSVGYGARLLDD